MWQEFRLTQRWCAWQGSIPCLRIVSAVGGYALGQTEVYPNTGLCIRILYNLMDSSVKEIIVSYVILVGALMITSGIVLANYELRRTKRQRLEYLRQRARRGIRINR